MNKIELFQVSRRRFMRQLTAIAASTGVPLWFLERQIAQAADETKSIKSPNARPRMALVGCGGMGTGDANNSQRFASCAFAR